MLILLIPMCVLFFIIVAGAIGDDVAAPRGGLVGSLPDVVVLSLLYAPVLMARDGDHNGQTLGKQIVGIRVVPNGGERWTSAGGSCARS